MRKTLFTLIVLLSNFQGALAQECGTNVTAEQLEFMNSLDYSKSDFSARTEQAIVEIPLKFHVVRQSNGEGGISASALNNALVKLNTFYENADIRFFQYQDINYIDNDDLYDFDASEERRVAVPNDERRVINVYFFNSMTSSGSNLCGYTYFPPSADRVMMVNGCTTSGNTFAHEIGHYFTLFHTHGKTNTGTTDELVDGSNCQNRGDNICDTPADPNLSGNVNSSCQYTGSNRDSNGATFSPMVSNIMSYAPPQCRTLFTNGQYDRIRRGFELGRSYLNFTSSEFTVFFTEDKNETCINTSIAFEAIAFGAQSYQWTFEGGTPSTASVKNPKIQYNQGGNFTTTLKVTNGSGEQAIFEKTNYISVIDPLENSVTENILSSFDNNQLPLNWSITNPDLALTFEVIEGFDSKNDPTSNAIFVNNFNYTTDVPRNEDILRLPAFKVDGVRGYTINFDYAYSFRPGLFEVIPAIYDSIKLVLDNACQAENFVIWENGGVNLATTDAKDTEFFPSLEEWREESVYYKRTDANDEYGAIELHNISYNGNNIFFDNLELIPDYGVDAPSDLFTANVSSKGIELKWNDNSINEQAFQIYKSVDNGDFQLIGTVEANTTSYLDLSIQGSSVQYYVLATGVDDNVSDNSNTILVDTAVITSLDIEDNGNFNVWPNPSNGLVNVSVNERSRFRILDVFGRTKMEGILLPNSNNQIDMSSLAMGNYLILINDEMKNKVIRIMITSE